MAIHLLRDYQTQNVTTTNRAYIFSYILILFMRRVLGYSYIGDTNYPINGIGTLLISTGDSNPTGAPSFPVGNRAGINIGFQKEFYVTIPSSVRVVSGNDIGRLLVLRSTVNPTFNSGVFLIVGFDTASNSYIIDYRTLGDKPPVEAADTLMWYLYEKDLNCPINGAVNTKTVNEYRGDGNSATPRIVLQSPHPLGWQIRICNETASDFASGQAAGNCAQMTATPGFGGTTLGDFPTFGQHCHAPMWYNSHDNNYLGCAPGFGEGGGFTGIQFRCTLVGDDTGRGVVQYHRRTTQTSSSSITCFGLAENEPTPLPVNSHARLFVIGSGFSGNDGFGNRDMNDGALQVSITDFTGGNAQGMSATPFGVPAMAAASMWAYLSGGGQNTSPIYDSFATDNPFTSTTELLPIDIMQGTSANWNGSISQMLPYAPRTIGTIPHLREGRGNFGDFSPSTDFARSYQHLRKGLFIPWNGPNIIP